MDNPSITKETNTDTSSNNRPSFFQNSSPGQLVVLQQEEVPEATSKMAVRSDVTFDDNFVDLRDGSWTVDLKCMPRFTESRLNEKLIDNAMNMPDHIAPNAYRNKLQGYKLWKEGYLSKVRVKPDVEYGCVTLFLVKAFVSASMKSIKYIVYAHLDQSTGTVVKAKCNCKAGQGGCCKHVAALLYTLLDFSNLGLPCVPEDLTCTQVLQKWCEPGRKLNSTVAVKFADLSFEKAMPEKDKSCKRKRPAVSGSRTDFCATPPFAKVVASSKIQSLYESLEKAGKANLLAQTLKGNEFKPCDFFEHSGNPAQELAPSSNFMEMSYDIFKNMHAEMDSSLFAKATSASIAHNVGVTLQDIKVIEKETRKQASSHRWFLERSKRLTSSLFGRILRRRENVFPKSILDQIAKRRDGTGPNTAGLQWGIEKEKVALERYKTEFCHQGNVVECGLMINPKWPWLGASPDGLIIQDGMLVGGIEIKCPYTKRNLTVQDSCQDKNFFMGDSGSGPNLKEKHHYYYQCQGIMNIIGLSWLDIIVYTDIDIYVQRLECDCHFWKTVMLPKLATFFETFMLI